MTIFGKLFFICVVFWWGWLIPLVVLAGAKLTGYSWGRFWWACLIPLVIFGLMRWLLKDMVIA